MPFFVSLKALPERKSLVWLRGQKAALPAPPKAVKRLRELDFLRGVAILLVLCRHQQLFEFTVTMGWIGVDLFFVLSGFLVSGLLFKEYQRFGNVKPKTFLIRRGFKIYPVYYLFYVPYLVLLFSQRAVSLRKVAADLFFVQNYANGFGYAYGASWSLAVEEHFYFGFAFFLFLGLKYKWLALTKEGEGKKRRYNEISWVIVSLLVLCLAVRIVTNIYLPEKYLRHSFTMTHLRIDSLLAGVLVSYFYYFRPEGLKAFFQKHKNALAVVALLCLTWTPFLKPLQPLFIRTIGFTLLYIAFAIVLLYFLLSPKINQRLDALFSKPVVDFVSKVGFCSYSIYIVHTLSNTLTERLGIENHFFAFFFSTGISIAAGYAITHWLEDYFLKWRDKFCPNRKA